MISSEKHVGKFEERLRHWGAKLDELVTKADEIDSEAKTDYHLQIANFRTKHLAAQAKLAEFKAAGSGKWEHFKDGIESAWSELEIAFKDLKKNQQH